MARSIEVTGRILVAMAVGTMVASLGAIVAASLLGPGGQPPTAAVVGALLVTALLGGWRGLRAFERDRGQSPEDMLDKRAIYPGEIAQYNWAKSVRKVTSDDEDT